MDINDFSKKLEQKMQEVKSFVEGEDIKDILGVEAVNHFKKSFQQEGFEDKHVVKWADVKRQGIVRRNTRTAGVYFLYPPAFRGARNERHALCRGASVRERCLYLWQEEIQDDAAPVYGQVRCFKREY